MDRSIVKIHLSVAEGQFLVKDNASLRATSPDNLTLDVNAACRPNREHDIAVGRLVSRLCSLRKQVRFVDRDIASRRFRRRIKHYLNQTRDEPILDRNSQVRLRLGRRSKPEGAVPG